MPYLFMFGPKYEPKCKTKTVSGEDKKGRSDLQAIIVAHPGYR
jgi:hypothetical protein